MRGRILDQDRQPVAWTPVVYSLHPAHPAGGGELAGRVFSDALGTYVIEGLPAGRLTLTPPFEGFYHDEDVFETDLKGPLHHDFAIQGLVTLEGRVLPRVADKLKLWLDYTHPTGPVGIEGIIWRVRQLDLSPEGNFRFTALRPGEYTLHVVGEEHASVEEPLLLLDRHVRHDVPLQLGCTIFGRVKLLGPGKLADTGLFFFSLEHPWWQKAEVGKEGAYRLSGVPPGRLKVLFQHWSGPAYLDGNFTRRRMLLQTKGPLQRFDVTEVPPVRLNLTVQPPAACRKLAGKLVFLQEGVELQSSRFQVTRRDQGRIFIQPLSQGRVPRFRARQAGTGQSLPIRVAPGSYDVELRALGYKTIKRFLKVRHPQDLHVTLKRKPGRFITTSLKQAFFRVEARARGSQKWKLILWKDARVVLTEHPIPGVLRAFLPPGSYAFRASFDALASSQVGPLTIKDEEVPLDLSFDPKPGHGLHGRILLPSGGGVGGGTLYLWRLEQGVLTPLPAKTTIIQKESDSAYRIQGLTPGRYRLAMGQDGSHVLGDFTVGQEDRQRDWIFSGR